MKEIPEARCDGLQWLFTSVDKRDHEAARRSRLGQDDDGPCPMFRACEATVRDIQSGPHQSGLHGTWAGKLYGRRMRASA